jgi:hypothetical protein
MKKIFQVLKNRWAEYVIEILVIIIGITLSFFFNNLKENRVERKEEIKLLASIHENLATDTLTLDARLKILDILLHGYEQILSPTIDTFSNDSIVLFLDFAVTYTKFQGTAVGYEELKQSKSSTIIKNRLLLRTIILHYDQKYDLMTEWNEIDKGYVLDDMLPFLSKNMKYMEGKFLYNDVETTLQLLESDDYFKNMIKSGRLYKQIIRLLYLQLKESTKVLMKEIEAELKVLK